MEPELSRSQATTVTSRRDLHRPETRSARRRGDRQRPGSPLLRWAPRAAVLTALATATIAVPLADARPAAEAAAPVTRPLAGPSAYDVLSSAVQQTTPTSLLAAVPGAREISSGVSRAVDRDPLPGCDGQARPASQNGQIPSSDLCSLWDPQQALRGDAAVAISELNLNYRAVFGRDLCITDSYRPLAVQRRLAYTKPGLAATPGRSNHGWGLAVDLCSSETGNAAAMAWLRDNGPTYGWANPQWAQRGGSGPYEPWHWEYEPGTSGLGTNWDER